MSYLLAIETPPSPSLLNDPLEDHACHQARRACMPPFVFSVSGQVEFRRALYHMTSCQRRSCQSLRRKVLDGMTKKLHWLFGETVLLGCVHVQPYLFGARRVALDKHNFSAAADHLAHCPKESCAQLRRAIMLTIRDKVSPNVRPQTA